MYAFPLAAHREPTAPFVAHATERGMTLRDYFAGKALAALLFAPDPTLDPGRIAEAAYEFADAMLAAREAVPLQKQDEVPF